MILVGPREKGGHMLPENGEMAVRICLFGH